MQNANGGRNALSAVVDRVEPVGRIYLPALQILQDGKFDLVQVALGPAGLTMDFTLLKNRVYVKSFSSLYAGSAWPVFTVWRPRRAPGELGEPAMGGVAG